MRIDLYDEWHADRAFAAQVRTLVATPLARFSGKIVRVELSCRGPQSAAGKEWVAQVVLVRGPMIVISQPSLDQDLKSVEHFAQRIARGVARRLTKFTPFGGP